MPTIMRGLAAVKASFQANIDEHFHANLTSAQGAGDTVTATAEITSDAFRARGIDNHTTSYTVYLRGGKIVRWSSPLPPETPVANDGRAREPAGLLGLRPSLIK